MTRAAFIIARVCAPAIVLLLSPALARAQASTHVFFAPGEQRDPPAHQQIYEAGGGFERMLDGGLAVQTDVAAVVYFDAARSRTIGAIASIAGAYHFVRGRRVDPFGVAGYALQFRDYTTNMLTYGGGLRYWFREDRALLIEIRDHVAHQGPPIARYWTVRIGLVFR
jgi:hypothetical protein